MVRNSYRRRQTSLTAGRRYARYRCGGGTAQESGTARADDDDDSPSLHVDYAGDYHPKSLLNYEHSDCTTFTPTKDEQVSRTSFRLVFNFKLISLVYHICD